MILTVFLKSGVIEEHTLHENAPDVAAPFPFAIANDGGILYRKAGLETFYRIPPTAYQKFTLTH